MTRIDRPNIPFIDSRLITWFLPPELRQSGTYEAYKHRIVLMIALSLVFWGPFFAILYDVVLNLREVAFVIVGSSILSVGAIILLRKTHSRRLAGHILCLSLVVLLIYLTTIDGGLESSALYWLLLLPLMASIYHEGRLSSYVWGGVVIACVAFFFVADLVGREFTSLYTPEQKTIILASALISLIFAVFALFSIRFSFETWLRDVAKREEAEKRRTEEQLHRSRERAWEQTQKGLRALMEHSPDGIAVARGHVVLYANPFIIDLLGYDEDEMVGMSVEKFRSEAEGPKVAQLDRQLRGRDSISCLEMVLLRKDGSQVPVEIHAFRTVFDEEPAVMLVIRDLTERRQLRAKMMQMDRMLAVGTLAAGVAHEINNPLSFVHCNLEYLLRGLPKEGGEIFPDFSPDEIREAIVDGLNGTSRIRDIVADLGTFSVSEEMSFSPMSVEETLQSAVRMASNQIHHRAQLVCDFQDLPNIESDEPRLAQVFLNLLVNAAQSITEGTLEENEITLRTRQGNAEVIVEISDTGEGISPQNLPRIFDPFMTTKPQEMGMGLGLSICQNIMQRLGGRIEVESVLGKGSTFRLYIPAIFTADDSAEFSTPAVDLSASKERLVIIDDESTLLRGLKRQFSKRFDIETFTSGSDVLAYLHSSETPYAILCDLQIPHMSGVEIYRRLCDELPDCADILIFMTGGAFTSEVQQFLEINHRPLLPKPFDTGQFLSCLQTLEKSSEIKSDREAEEI